MKKIYFANKQIFKLQFSILQNIYGCITKCTINYVNFENNRNYRMNCLSIVSVYKANSRKMILYYIATENF